MSKEDFKEFAKKHPILNTYVKDKKMTWQRFYELYDIYGEDAKIWDDYLDENRSISLKGIGSMVKNIKIDSVQKYVNNAQKAISLFQEIGLKKTPDLSALTKKGPLKNRPINKIFED